MPLNLFAIRHRPTGRFLPQPQGRGGRGFTHVEPREYTGEPHTIPRLFPSRKNAHLALKEWCKGKMYRDASMDGDEDFERRPVKGRNFSDMEIIPMALIPEAMVDPD